MPVVLPSALSNASHTARSTGSPDCVASAAARYWSVSKRSTPCSGQVASKRSMWSAGIEERRSNPASSTSTPTPGRWALNIPEAASYKSTAHSETPKKAAASSTACLHSRSGSRSTLSARRMVCMASSAAGPLEGRIAGRFGVLTHSSLNETVPGLATVGWLSLARLFAAAGRDGRGRWLWLGGRPCSVRATCRRRLQTLIGAHVALLILLAASAPAWIVPANLFGAAHRLRLAAAIAAIGLHALHGDGGGHYHQLRVVDSVHNVL